MGCQAATQVQPLDLLQLSIREYGREFAGGWSKAGEMPVVSRSKNAKFIDALYDQQSATSLQRYGPEIHNTARF